MMLSDLASAMGEVVGLTKEDVMPMFLQSGRMEEVRSQSMCAIVNLLYGHSTLIRLARFRGEEGVAPITPAHENS